MISLWTWSVKYLEYAKIKNGLRSLIAARRDTFMLSFVYNRVSIHKYKAYWHMNFSLINGCGTCENNNSWSFFWSAACQFTNIIIVTKKVNKQV